MTTNLLNTSLYRSLYPDLAAAGLTTDAQLRSHFLNFGANEGRTFSQFLNFPYYQSSNVDLGLAGLTTNRQLFDHMENFGASEGRRASITFNSAFYRSRNPDLIAAGLTNEQLFLHYENFGIREGRDASEYFSPRFYLNTYPDLTAAFGNNFQLALQHYLTFGIREGRTGSPAVSPITDPGNSASTAYNMGTVLNKATLSDFLGISDQEDVYRFNLDNPSYLNLSVSGLSTPVTVKLYADINSNFQIDSGEELGSFDGNSTTPISINKTLGAGAYYIDIVTGTPVSNSLYNLSFSQSPAPRNTPTDPGNSQNAALDVGSLNGSSRNYVDFVGSTDRLDFYKFVLTNTSTFNMSLGGTSDLAHALVYVDTNGNAQIEVNEILGLISAPANSGVVSFNQTLAPGTYYVDVFTNTPLSNTNYNLTMSA